MSSRVWAALSAAVLVSTGAAWTGLTAPSARADADTGCSDVTLVFARGTFEAPGAGAVGDALTQSLTGRLGDRTLQVQPVDYPASLDFARAADGVLNARNVIQSTVARCPHTAIVLGGYSQGAAVAGYVTADAVPDGYVAPDGMTTPLAPELARHIAAVTLFGTPSPGVLGLLDHDAPPLTIGSTFVGKTVQYCADGDPICAPGGTDRAAHSAYKVNGMTDQAADFVVGKLGRADGRGRESTPVAQLAGAVNAN
ncbi:cutinase [Mycolicibacterium madagascariense]|uniref:Cutinase n=1 Tax=Mycolicibacterium madagascariense TaxID=212765 RepID=A0A7I7XDS8_9MYCO|nr:cutinase family protein [Mycolicibacterium madagascariense]BBZ27585.1 cutinase [Mycolicibacterium madagascariense]